ncbi:MAG TPA: fructoselysine kinase [Chloroflexi bacterium]|nr:fructoselysine kinase [Chloroflexota bacterium]
MVSIIGVGDNTVDCYLHLGKMYPGGNAVNVPVLAHRYGVNASYLGWLAKDQRGNLLIDSLNKEGIDFSHSRIITGENAYCEVNVVDGDRVFGQFSEGVCSQIQLTEADLAFIASHDLVHTSLYSFIEPYIIELHKTSPKVSFDFTSDWDQDYLAQYAKHVDIALLSSHTANLYENRELLAWIASQGPEIVIITGGEQGALVYDGKQYYSQLVVPATNIVDTLGAGDAFAARFLVEYLRKTHLPTALLLAAQSAARTCQYYGAFGYGAPITNNKFIQKKG